MALVSLTGTKALECLSRYELSFVLRSFDDSVSPAVDDGALNFRPYDPGSFPVGNGYFAEMRDASRRTLLATGAVNQRGGRAKQTLNLFGNAADGETVEIDYPDLSDETQVSPVIISRVYTFKTTPTLQNQVLIGATPLDSINNLVKCINGNLDYGDTYTAGLLTEACNELVANASSTTEMTLGARDGGVWGNAVTVDYPTGTPSWGGATLEDGTGNRGLLLTFIDSDLPNSLMESGADTERRVYIDIIGVNSTGAATKLVACPSQLHATATDASAITQ